MLIIRVEDRREFGQGHRSRAIALAQAAERQRIGFTILAGDAEWHSELLQEGLNSVLLPFEGEQQEATIIANGVKDLFVSALILDGSRFGNDLVRVLSEREYNIVLIDDTAEAPKREASYVVNPNVYATDDLYFSKWGVKSYTGKQYILLREPFIKQTPVSIKEKSVCLALGLFGGSQLIEMLKAGLTELGYNVDIPNRLTSSQMVSLIDSSELIICGASVTLHEVWSRNRKALPVYQARDQSHFYKYLNEMAIPCVKSLDREPELTYSEIIAIVTESMNHDEIPLIAVNKHGSDLLLKELIGNFRIRMI